MPPSKNDVGNPWRTKGPTATSWAAVTPVSKGQIKKNANGSVPIAIYSPIFELGFERYFCHPCDMKTKPYCFALPIAAAAGLLLASPSAPAQDGAKQEAAPPDEAAMMEAYMKLIAPGPEHKLLKSLVGDWTATQTLWVAPGAPAEKHPGTAKFRMAMGGRFLVQNYASEIAGMGKFQGRGTTGYDKVAKEYIQTWIDSFGTGIMVSKGKATDDKTIVLTGEAVDPFTKEKVAFRTVSKYVDENAHEMEMYEKKAGAGERKLMHIAYKRVKDAKPKPANKQDKKQKQDKE